MVTSMIRITKKSNLYLRVWTYWCWSLSKIWPSEATKMNREVCLRRKWTRSSSWLIITFSESRFKSSNSCFNLQKSLSKWPKGLWMKWKRTKKAMSFTTSQIDFIGLCMSCCWRCTWTKLIHLTNTSGWFSKQSKVMIVCRGAWPLLKGCFKCLTLMRLTLQPRLCW